MTLIQSDWRHHLCDEAKKVPDSFEWTLEKDKEFPYKLTLSLVRKKEAIVTKIKNVECKEVMYTNFWGRDVTRTVTRPKQFTEVGTKEYVVIKATNEKSYWNERTGSDSDFNLGSYAEYREIIPEGKGGTLINGYYSVSDVFYVYGHRGIYNVYDLNASWVTEASRQAMVYAKENWIINSDKKKIVRIIDDINP